MNVRAPWALVFALLLPACPSPRYGWVHAECAWVKGRVPDAVDLDTRELVSLTHEVSVRHEAIAASWSDALHHLEDGLKLDRNDDPTKAVDKVRSEAQLLLSAGCTFAWSKHWESSGDPDDELRRTSSLRIEWKATCPVPDAHKARLELLSVATHDVRELLEASSRYRALLPKVEAIATRKRLIPVGPTDEEKREWTCAMDQVSVLREDIQRKTATADALEAIFSGSKT